MTAEGAGPPPQPDLASLDGDDDDLRIKAMDWIGTERPDGAFELLAPFLDHQSRDVRQTAAVNLADVGDPRAVPLLLDIAYRDPDKDMRDEAVRALGAWRDERILRCLLHEVQRPDRSWVVLRAVAEQLRHYDRPEAIDALFQLLGDEELHVQDKAAESLLLLNRPSFRPRWEQARRAEDERMRLAAEEALAALDAAADADDGSD